MKKIIVFVLFLIITIIFSIYNVTYAADIDGIIGGADDFMNAGQSASGTGIDWSGITGASDLIYNTLLILGTVIAVIVAAYLGIKFMVSSVEEQAKVKEALIPFVVGCVIIFGAFGIWKLTTNILEDANEEQQQEQQGSGGTGGNSGGLIKPGGFTEIHVK